MKTKQHACDASKTVILKDNVLCIINKFGEASVTKFPSRESAQKEFSRITVKKKGRKPLMKHFGGIQPHQYFKFDPRTK